MAAEKIQAGKEVIHEVLNLLQGLEFSVEEGATAGGDQVRIVLAPRWNGVDAFQLMLTCFPFGDRGVDWANMPVRITAVSSPNSPAFVFRINPRGQAVIDGVPPGDYKVSVMSTYFGGLEEPAFVPGNKPEQLATFGTTTQSDWKESLFAYTSNDGQLMAFPEVDTGGRTRITFESAAGAWMDGTVRFALVEASGRVVLAEELALTKDEARSIWGDYWEGKLNLAAAVFLVFDFLPAVSGVDA